MSSHDELVAGPRPPQSEIRGYGQAQARLQSRGMG